MFSWSINLSSIGSVVLFLHDGSDVLLELAKLFNYCKWQSWTDATFVLFAISFFVCRIVLLPYRVLYTTMIDARFLWGVWFPYWFFNIFLLTLYCLHIFWMSIIAKMAYQFMRTGEVAKDARSDSDDDDEEPVKQAQQQAQQPKKVR
jgi:hypothetical protein